MAANPTVQTRSLVTPARVMLALGAVFISELVAMALLELVPGWPEPLRALLDAGVLLVLALPVILVTLVQPLVSEVRQRRTAETKLQATEAALRESEELHRVTLASINEAVFLLDGSGAFVFVCPNVHGVFGYAIDDVHGLGTIHELLGPDVYDAQRVAAEGEVADLEREFMKADGERRVGLVSFSRVSIGEAVALCTCRDVTDRSRAREAERLAHRRFQKLARRFVGVQESERQRVARELHDEAGQGLTSLKLGLKVLETSANGDVELRRRCDELRRIADDVHEGLHRLAVSLRPAALSHLGLERAVAEHLAGVGDSAGLTVRFASRGAVDECAESPVEIALYRFVQEAVTNVIRHAGATSVSVLLERRNGSLVARVEDDGRGFGPIGGNGSGGLGIAGMRERAELLGGNVCIESPPGGGSSVVMELPVT